MYKRTANTLDKMMTSLSLTKQEKNVCWELFRLGIYILILMFLVLGMWQLADYYKISTFREYGPIESMQIGTLLVSTIFFVHGAVKSRIFRPILLFLASLTTFCCIRELDAFFEDMFPIISWKFAWFFPMLGAWFMFKKRKFLRKTLFSFSNSSAFHLMVAALIIFIPLAQCLGHRSFIEDAVNSSGNSALIRRMVEESMELMAYVLVFLSAIELHFGLLKKRKD